MNTYGYRKVASEADMSFRLNQWMKAVRAPTPYRVGGRTVNVSGVTYAKMAIIVLLVLTICVLTLPAIHAQKGKGVLRFCSVCVIGCEREKVRT